MIFYKANYDTLDGVKCGTIKALRNKNKKYIKQRLLSFGIDASRIYNIAKEFNK